MNYYLKVFNTEHDWCIFELDMDNNRVRRIAAPKIASWITMEREWLPEGNMGFIPSTKNWQYDVLTEGELMLELL